VLVAAAVAVVLTGCGAAKATGPTPGAAEPVVLPARAQASIDAMSFPTAQGGWIAVSSSAPGETRSTQSILTTANGGATWRQSWAGSEVPFFSTSQGSDYGWVLAGSSPACGDARASSSQCPASSLLSTSDAGASWQKLPAPPIRLSQLAFASPKVGLAASSPSCAANSALTAAPCPGEVLLTTDGGSQWKVVLRAPGLVAAIGAEGSTLWAVTGLPGLASKAPGASSPRLLVMRSLNEGSTWSQVASLGPLFQIGPGLEARLLLGPRGQMWLSYLEQDSCAMHGCAAGGFESLDGGLSWRPNGAPNPGSEADCGAFSPPGSVAIAPTGVVFGTYQRNLATCEAPAAALSEYSNGAWRLVHAWNYFSPRELAFPTATAGYAESGAALLTSRDGGASWSQAWPLATPTDGLDAISRTTAFGYGAQGSDSSILETTNSGRTWNVVGSLPTQVLALDMDSAQVGFAAAATSGAAQTFGLYRTRDGGRSWTLVGAGFPLRGWEVLGLWLTPAGNGAWAVNGNETGGGLRRPTGFFAATDGGQRWQGEGALAHGYNLVAAATFAPTSKGVWLGLAEVNQGRESELKMSRDLGRRWSSVGGAPSHLVTLWISDRGALAGATMDSGASAQLTLYRAPAAGEHWTRDAARSTVVEDAYAGAAAVVSLAGPSTAWLLAAGTVWETVDGGASWQPASPLN